MDEQQGNGSTATTTENTSQTGGLADFSTAIPESYHGDEWYQNIVRSESSDKFGLLADQFKNAQKLIGQKNGLQVPAPDADPIQWKTFHDTYAPKSLDEYKYEPPVWGETEKDAGAYLSEIHNDAFVKDAMQLSMEAGLTPQQFKQLAQGYDKLSLKHHRGMIDEMRTANEAMNQDFDTKAAQVFGANKDQVLQQGKQALEKMIPADSQLRVWMNQMSNEQLLMIAGVTAQFNQQRMKEDGMNQSGVSSNGAMSAAEHKRVGMELMADANYADPFSNPAAHAQAVARVQAHYGKMPNERLKEV